MINARGSASTLAERLWTAATPAEQVLRMVVLAVAGSLLMWASAKVQVPFYPVPMTMQTAVAFLIGIAYGPRLGAATIALYLAQGAIGLPVFAGTPEKGIGLPYMMGPTGGYLLGLRGCGSDHRLGGRALVALAGHRPRRAGGHRCDVPAGRRLAGDDDRPRQGDHFWRGTLPAGRPGEAAAGHHHRRCRPQHPASAGLSLIVEPTPAAIGRAARLLHHGRLVAFPTETVYGLGALATSDAAVAATFAAKGRPSHNPLIVHVADAMAAAARRRLR